MPSPASKDKVNDGPTTKGGPSPWLLLIVAAFLILVVVHIRTTAPAKAKQKPTAQPAFAAKPSTSEPDAVPAFENAQPNRFTVLVHDCARNSDPDQREDLLAAWVKGIRTDEIPGWLTFLETASPADIAQDLRQRLLRRWTDASPEQAAAWLAALPADQQMALVDDVAIPWANSQATNAMNWARSLRDDAARQHAIAAVAGETIRSQPLLALEMTLNLPAGPQRDDLIRRGAMQWASADADSAVAWAKQIPAGDLRNQALSGVAIVWSVSEPAAAATMALDELPPGRILDDTVISIIQRWAQQDPTAAAAWVDQFPPGPLRTTAEENLMALAPTRPEESAHR